MKLPDTAPAQKQKWMLAGALVLALCAPAFAALGDNASSVLTDQARMKGTLRQTDKQGYVLHEIAAPTGAKVREYASPSGVIFGVAWEGQFPPNFQELLGPYYQQLQNAIAQQKSAAEASGQAPRRRGPAYVETPGLVLVQTGHSHSFHGQAYIPQLVPTGVQPSDIR
jgi:hypothetical protein